MAKHEITRNKMQSFQNFWFRTKQNATQNQERNKGNLVNPGTGMRRSQQTEKKIRWQE